MTTNHQNTSATSSLMEIDEQAFEKHAQERKKQKEIQKQRQNARKLRHARLTRQERAYYI